MHMQEKSRGYHACMFRKYLSIDTCQNLQFCVKDLGMTQSVCTRLKIHFALLPERIFSHALNFVNMWGTFSLLFISTSTDDITRAAFCLRCIFVIFFSLFSGNWRLASFIKIISHICLTLVTTYLNIYQKLEKWQTHMHAPLHAMKLLHIIF